MHPTDQVAAHAAVHPSRPSNVGGQPYKLLRRFSLLSLLSVSLVFGVCSLLVADFLTKHMVHRDAVLTMEFLQSVADVENEIAYGKDAFPISATATSNNSSRMYRACRTCCARTSTPPIGK